jgi:hypothetical protein
VARPRRIGSAGAGAWVIASQWRQEHLGLTWRTTRNRPGTQSKISVTSSPSGRKLPPQAGQASGMECCTILRGRCSGSGRRAGLRLPGAARSASASSAAGGAVAVAVSASNSSSASSSWSASAASRSERRPNCIRRRRASCSRSLSRSRRWAANSASRIASAASLSASAAACAATMARKAFASSGRAARSRVTAGMMADAAASRPMTPARASSPLRLLQPAISVLQVRTGVRQSIPSRSMESIAGVSETTPSWAAGQTKRPRSRRLA